MDQEGPSLSPDEQSLSKDESSTKKRKEASSSLIAAYGGAPRRRAAKACYACGRRKIRCDVVDHGSPCSNCTYDNVACVIATRPRRRRKLDDPAKINVAPSSSTNDDPTLVDEFSSERPFETKKSLDGMVDFDPLSPATLGANAGIRHVPHLIYQMQSEKEQNRIIDGMEEAGVLNDFPINGSDLSFLTNVVRGAVPSPDVASAIDLPLFVKPLPPNINDDDVEYLWRKGSLSIPEMPLRRELLRSYVEHVHGQMPILELNDFLQIVDHDDGKMGQISLLLFQCVMFAGAAFVNLQHLQQAGFPTRLDARKAYFLKARGLYDLDYEMEPVTLVQSLHLMTLWYLTPDDQKDMWYWSGVTTSLSLATGLHSPAGPAKSRKTQKLWKRIGWSIFIRDKLVALGTQRPTRIHAGDHSLPMLTMDDFELQPVPWDIACIGTDCTFARDVTKLRIMAALNIEMAKVSLCFSHVLATQYTGLQQKPGSIGSDSALKTSLLSPKTDNDEVQGFQECAHELTAWLSQRPEETKYSGFLIALPEYGEEGILVYRAMLDMFYNSTIIMLFGPKSIKETTATGNSPPAANNSQLKVQQAALEITNVGQDLLRLNVLHFIPGYGVSILLTAIMTHLRGMQSPDTYVKTTSAQRFRDCMGLLQSVRDIHPGADLIIKILEPATGKIDNTRRSYEMRLDDSPENVLSNIDFQEERYQWQGLRLTQEEEQLLLAFTNAGSGVSTDAVLENDGNRVGTGVEEALNLHPENELNDPESELDHDESMDLGAIYFGVPEEVEGKVSGDLSTEWAEYASDTLPQSSTKPKSTGDSYGGLLQDIEVLWSKFPMNS